MKSKATSGIHCITKDRLLLILLGCQSQIGDTDGAGLDVKEQSRTTT